MANIVPIKEVSNLKTRAGAQSSEHATNSKTEEYSSFSASTSADEDLLLSERFKTASKWRNSNIETAVSGGKTAVPLQASQTSWANFKMKRLTPFERCALKKRRQLIKRKCPHSNKDDKEKKKARVKLRQKSLRTFIKVEEEAPKTTPIKANKLSKPPKHRKCTGPWNPEERRALKEIAKHYKHDHKKVGWRPANSIKWGYALKLPRYAKTLQGRSAAQCSAKWRQLNK